MLPDDLSTITPTALYDALDDLALYRQSNGRGRSAQANHVKRYCAAERARVKAELKRRGLRQTRPGDTRVYGPGQATWQCSGGCAK